MGNIERDLCDEFESRSGLSTIVSAGAVVLDWFMMLAIISHEDRKLECEYLISMVQESNR